MEDDFKKNMKPAVRRLHIKNEKERLLSESSFSQLADVQEIMTEKEKKEWKEYRQKIRDFSSKKVDIEKLKWPKKPKVNNKIIGE